MIYYSKMGDNSDFTVIFNLKCYAQISKLINYFIKNKRNYTNKNNKTKIERMKI